MHTREHAREGHKQGERRGDVPEPPRPEPCSGGDRPENREMVRKGWASVRDEQRS